MEIKIEKKEKIKNLILVLVAGLMLLIVSVPGLWTKKSSEKTNAGRSVAEDYKEQIGNSAEQRLETILSEVKGAGKVESMIFFQGGDEKGEIEGILIVAEGAGNAEIVRYISDAAEALFGIPKHKIIILPMQIKGK